MILLFFAPCKAKASETCYLQSQNGKHYGKNSSDLEKSLFFLYALCCYSGLITTFQNILTATLIPKLDIGENKLNISEHVITLKILTELTICWNHSYSVTHYFIWWPFPWHLNIIFIYNCKIQVWWWVNCKRFIPGRCLKAWTSLGKWINKTILSKAY